MGLVRGGVGGAPQENPHRRPQEVTDLTPDQHRAEDDLQPIEEVVPNDDDGGTSCCPPFARTDGLDAGGGCFLERGEERKDHFA